MLVSAERRPTMVKVYNAKGKHIFSEPPYTDEEEMAFYHAVSYRGGGATILHGSVPAPQPPPPAPPPPAVKPPKPPRAE